MIYNSIQYIYISFDNVDNNNYNIKMILTTSYLINKYLYSNINSNKN